MKLLIDIGNTKCSIALAEGKRILKRYFIHTGKNEVQPASLKRLFGKDLKRIDEAVIVSVVPKFLKIVKANIKKISPGISLKVVGRDIKVPMKVRYKAPKEIGQDRLVTAFGIIGSVKAPFVVIDFGTAVTFDLVNARSEYEGGLIFPGLRLALGSLEENTALLPHIDLKAPRGLVGRDTKGSMNKGVVLGYAAMCDGLIGRFRKQYGAGLNVLATGGDAALISRYSDQIKEVRKDLIFTGLLKLLS